MPVTQDDVRQRLHRIDPARVRAVLAAGAVRGSESNDPQDLADRLVRALWWRTHSPLGLVVAKDDLDDLVDRTAKRLGHELPDGDAWARLDALTRKVVPGDAPIRLDELDEDVIDRLESAQWTTWLGVGTAGGAAGTKVAADFLLELLDPIKDVLPLIPKVGPIAVAIQKGAKIAASVAGPIGIGVTLVTINDALGSDYDEAAPLLFGLGLLMREPVGETIEPVGETLYEATDEPVEDDVTVDDAVDDVDDVVADSEE